MNHTTGGQEKERRANKTLESGGRTCEEDLVPALLQQCTNRSTISADAWARHTQDLGVHVLGNEATQQVGRVDRHIARLQHDRVPSSDSASHSESHGMEKGEENKKR